jgi:hypothetical protein
MPTVLSDVRFQGKLGRHLLALCSSQFDPLQKSESAFHGISLLYLFPHQADDTHLAIATEGGGPSRVGHSIAFYLHVSNDRSASPHFVPRQVDMMFDFFYHRTNTFYHKRSSCGAGQRVADQSWPRLIQVSAVRRL